jgi:hypothetical protein
MKIVEPMKKTQIMVPIFYVQAQWWEGGYTTHGKTKGIYNVHFKQVMLITFLSGDCNKSLKLQVISHCCFVQVVKTIRASMNSITIGRWLRHEHKA